MTSIVFGIFLLPTLLGVFFAYSYWLQRLEIKPLRQNPIKVAGTIVFKTGNESYTPRSAGLATGLDVSTTMETPPIIRFDLHCEFTDKTGQRWQWRGTRMNAEDVFGKNMFDPIDMLYVETSPEINCPVDYLTWQEDKYTNAALLTLLGGIGVTAYLFYKYIARHPNWFS